MDIHTQLFADGTCTRRIEYALERVDPERGGRRVEIPADANPLLTMHRFPSEDPWRVEEETGTGVHRIVAEATLSSPNDFDGDFFRTRSPRTPPARNFVSAYTSPEDGVFEYNEVFRDPVSPLAGARALARQIGRRDQDFARHVLDALEGDTGAPSLDELRRTFGELFAEPFAQDVASLTARPLFGPRERRALEEVLEGFERRQQDLSQGLHSLAPGIAPEVLDQAVGSALDTLGQEVLDESEAAVQALGLGRRGARVHFRATLVMPYPILRANACVVGDTVVWEFEDDDLFGRGVEMMALASAP